MLTLFLIGMFTLKFNIQSVKTESATIIVPDDYPTIQEAINNANDGDTVYVRAGTYFENVVVNKTVSLVGENRENTIIDGNGTYWGVMKVTADNTLVTGFTVKNSNRFGIQIWKSFGNTIKENYVTDTFYGIRLDQSTNNSMIGNIVKSNSFMGILLSNSKNNILRYNEMADNPQNFGVWSISIHDFISDVDNSNTVNGKPIYYWVNQHDSQIPADAGVVIVVNSTSIVVKNLTLTNNDHGVYFAYTTSSSIESNAVTNSTYGIDLFHSFNNTISGNMVSDNTLGVSMRFTSDNNIVRNNTIATNSNGIYLYQSDGNIVTGNLIYDNYNYGIDLTESNRNFFHHNNLIENKKSVSPYSSGNNVWDDGYPSGGNHWSDYEERYPDAKELDDSGIWDTPYVIDENNQDNYPLMNPWTPTPTVTIATIDIDPDTLNLRSKGKWITAYIELPEGYSVGDIDRTTVMLNDTIPVDTFWVDKPLESVIGDYDEDGIPDLMVKFDRVEVIEFIFNANSLPNNKSIYVMLTLTGQLTDETPFEGNDTIRIVLPYYKYTMYKHSSYKRTLIPI